MIAPSPSLIRPSSSITATRILSIVVLHRHNATDGEPVVSRDRGGPAERLDPAADSAQAEPLPNRGGSHPIVLVDEAQPRADIDPDRDRPRTRVPRGVRK